MGLLHEVHHGNTSMQHTNLLCSSSKGVQVSLQSKGRLCQAAADEQSAKPNRNLQPRRKERKTRFCGQASKATSSTM
jgi:hypothetical protein